MPPAACMPLVTLISALMYMIAWLLIWCIARPLLGRSVTEQVFHTRRGEMFGSQGPAELVKFLSGPLIILLAFFGVLIALGCLFGLLVWLLGML